MHREVVPHNFTDKTLQPPTIPTEPIGNRLRVFPIQIAEKTFDERHRILTSFQPIIKNQFLSFIYTVQIWKKHFTMKHRL